MKCSNDVDTDANAEKKTKQLLIQGSPVKPET